MGLKCSLLGHEYGEATTEREREEQGGEVIVEERELQVCSRCGKEKVLSENTEVRTLQADPQSGDLDSTTPESEPADVSFSEPAEASVSSDSTGSDLSGSTPAEHAPSADEDDAVILDDEPGEDRDSRQWPDEAQQEAMRETADTGEPEPEPEPWPEQEGDDEGFDAKPAGDDESAGDVDFSGGLTPESAEAGDAGDEGFVEAPSEPATDASGFGTSSGASGSDAPADSGVGSQSGSPSRSSRKPQRGAGESEVESVEDAGFTSAGPVNPPTGSTDDADSVLVCPECGFERRAARASLRAGDICPDCKKGYLAERR